MKIWHDSTGRPWATVLNVGVVKRVKELTGRNILDLAGGALAGEVMADPCLLCDILYAVHKQEADKNGVTDEAFAECLSGDSIAEATDALMGALIDFFPSRQRRELLAEAMKKAKAEEARIIEDARAELERTATSTA